MGQSGQQESLLMALGYGWKTIRITCSFCLVTIKLPAFSPWQTASWKAAGFAPDVYFKTCFVHPDYMFTVHREVESIFLAVILWFFVPWTISTSQMWYKYLSKPNTDAILGHCQKLPLTRKLSTWAVENICNHIGTKTCTNASGIWPSASQFLGEDRFWYSLEATSKYKTHSSYIIILVGLFWK